LRSIAGTTSHINNVLGVPGGLPIKIGDETIGGIGVAGAPGDSGDEGCAAAGIEKIKDELKRSNGRIYETRRLNTVGGRHTPSPGPMARGSTFVVRIVQLSFGPGGSRMIWSRINGSGSDPRYWPLVP